LSRRRVVFADTPDDLYACIDCDAFSNQSIGVRLLFICMLKEFTRSGLRINATRHKVVPLVARYQRPATSMGRLDVGDLDRIVEERLGETEVESLL